MKKIVKLTESDLSRIVRRVIREEESNKEEKIEDAKEVISDILKPSEIQFLKQKFEEEGKEGFKDEIVAAAQDIESVDNGELSEDDMDNMSDDEYKMRSILHKIIRNSTALAGIGIVPAAMFSGGAAAIGLGVAALLGVIFKDAAFFKRGGHHYAAQARAEKEMMKESYRRRQYRRR